MTDPTREAFDSDVDLMRYVYMLPSQREAYERILQAALSAPKQQAVEVTEALKVAEAALADIGDADREPGDDIAWAERRAAEALPQVRAALLAALPGKTEVE